MKVFLSGSKTVKSLPEKLTAISESTFTDCQKLSDVVIPDSVKIIGKVVWAGSKLDTIK